MKKGKSITNGMTKVIFMMMFLVLCLICTRKEQLKAYPEQLTAEQMAGATIITEYYVDSDNDDEISSWNTEEREDNTYIDNSRLYRITCDECIRFKYEYSFLGEMHLTYFYNESGVHLNFTHGTLNPGTYYFYSDLSSYRRIYIDRYGDKEPNDSFQQAQQVTFGNEQKGMFAKNEIADCYKIDILQKSYLKLDSSNCDRTTFTLYNNSGENIWSKRFADDWSFSDYLNRELEAGSYYLVATPNEDNDAFSNGYGYDTYNFTVDCATSLSLASMTDIADQTYAQGNAIEPGFSVSCNGTTLVKGTDYTVKYSKNKNVGTATVTVTGIGKYYGKIEKQFAIKPAQIEKALSSVKGKVTYDGNPKEPKLTVTYGGKTLKQGADKDYTVVYNNNIEAGKATAVITGKGNYTGTKTVKFTIAKKSIEGVRVDPISDKTYSGKAIKPNPFVTLNGAAFSNGDEYTVSYKNNTNAGNAKLIIKGKGNYTGTKTVSFKIKKVSIAKCSIGKVKAQKYTGKAIRPIVSVKYKGKKLSFGKDYTIAYKNNLKVGTGQIIISGKGNYSGRKTIKFAIKKK